MKIYKVSCGQSAERGTDSWLIVARNITDAVAKGKKKLDFYSGEIISVILIGKVND